MYQPRFYRKWINEELKNFNVTYKDTDLLIRAPIIVEDICRERVKKLRKCLDNYIKNNPKFINSLRPLKLKGDEPPPIKEMIINSRKVGVGPMAGVAGLFAERAGKRVLQETNQVIVENGGDIYMAVNRDCVIGVYAGDESPYSGKLGIQITSEQMPLGICTSAGNIGPSYSKGTADAVTVISRSTVLADTAATAAGNMIKEKDDIENTINWLKKMKDIKGILIIKDDSIGVWGELELIKTGNK